MSEATPLDLTGFRFTGGYSKDEPITSRFEVMEWRKYPDIKPEGSNFYMVDINDGGTETRRRFIFWSNLSEDWAGLNDKEEVIAWANYPKGWMG